MDLKVISQAFTSQHLSGGKGDAPCKHPFKSDSPVGKLMRSMFWGTVIMFGGAGLGGVLRVLGRQGVRPAGEFTPYLEAFAVLMGLGGLFYIAYALLYATTTNLRSPKAVTSKTEPTSEIPQDRLPEPILSVTEQTTELLGKVDANISVRDTAPQG